MGIFERVCEGVMREMSATPSIALTGTRLGLSYEMWEHLIRSELREPKFGTPRCTRRRAWNVDDRLEELNEHSP